MQANADRYGRTSVNRRPPVQFFTV